MNKQMHLTGFMIYCLAPHMIMSSVYPRSKSAINGARRMMGGDCADAGARHAGNVLAFHFRRSTLKKLK